MALGFRVRMRTRALDPDSPALCGTASVRCLVHSANQMVGRAWDAEVKPHSRPAGAGGTSAHGHTAFQAGPAPTHNAQVYLPARRLFTKTETCSSAPPGHLGQGLLKQGRGTRPQKGWGGRNEDPGRTREPSWEAAGSQPVRCPPSPRRGRRHRRSAPYAPGERDSGGLAQQSG